MKQFNLNSQAIVISKIIAEIEAENFYNASILIRHELNDKHYYWYKPIEFIIDNQISNLFYDIENGTNLTADFFKRQLNKINYLIKNEI